MSQQSSGGPPPPPPAQPIEAVPAEPAPPAGEPLGGLIPYRNGPALAAYYLGVFSLIPLVGTFLGVAALVLGIVGLRKAARQPEVRGKVHAWVGIILGGLFGFGWPVAMVLIVVW